jgi:hypothetical protein
MRQQQYEQALKDIRNALWEANEHSIPYTGISEAIAIIDAVYPKCAALCGDTKAETYSDASIKRDVANNHSGQ